MSIGREAYKDSNQDRYFAEDSLPGGRPKMPEPGSFPDHVDGYAEPEFAKVDLKEYRGEHNSYDFKNMFIWKSMNMAEFGLNGLHEDREDSMYSPSGLYGLSSRQEIFIQDMLYEDYSFSDDYDGKIPVVVPRNMIFEHENFSWETNEELYETGRELLKKHLGTEHRLITKEVSSSRFNQFDETPPAERAEVLDIECIIVGYQHEYYTNIFVPDWALEKNNELALLFEDSQESLVLEFSTRDERNEFVQEKRDSGQYNVQAVLGRWEVFETGITIARRIAYAVGGFLLTISALFILTTVAKIVADSRKEIGVFRAVGAQKRDIKKIFFSYAFMLTTLGFIIGLVIAVIFNGALSLIYGDEIFYEMASFGVTQDISQPILLFVGVPVVQVTLLYIFVLLVGFAASYLPARKAAKLDPIVALREG